jgi:c-di-GMP-binding flagellar brake protein YcgR
MRDEGRIAARVRPRPGEQIEIQLMGAHFLDIFEARDISITGVGIFVPYRFEGCDLSSPMDLVITLPGRPPFLAKGRVVHRTKTEREFFGVEFESLAPEPTREIARYVEERLAEERPGTPEPAPR